MSKCTIVYEVNFDIKEDLLRGCVLEVMRRENVAGSVSVVFVSYDKIKQMNKDFFEKDKATDVLSFESGERENNKEGTYLGEILICPEFLNNKEDLQWEILHLAVHGTFHLIGKHHEDIEGGYELIHQQELEIINYVTNRVD